MYQDHDSEESEWEEIHCGKPTARKKQPKESKGKKFRKKLNAQDCEEEWDDNDPHVWVECNKCENVPVLNIKLKSTGK